MNSLFSLVVVVVVISLVHARCEKTEQFNEVTEQREQREREDERVVKVECEHTRNNVKLNSIAYSSRHCVVVVVVVREKCGYFRLK